eukprot:4134557-Pyramimonas_sp.AAC.1
MLIPGVEIPNMMIWHASRSSRICFAELNCQEWFSGSVPETHTVVFQWGSSLTLSERIPCNIVDEYW